MRLPWLAQGLAVLALPFGIGGSPSAGAEAPASIESRLQLFLDGSFLEKAEGVRLVIHPPVPREVALTFDALWEGQQSGYVTVFRDGLRWQRTFLEAFLRPGPAAENWGQAHGNNTPAWGLLSTSREEISFYWSENYGSAPHVRRGTLRLDGFVSAAAGYAGGSLVTKPFTFRGRRLVVNYATWAVGKIQVEAQTVEGEVMLGYAAADCPEIYGDATERVVQWRTAPVVAALAHRPIRLRFVLKDADLYSFRFAE